MRSTIELLLDLVSQSQQLLRVELSLVRAELGERVSLLMRSLIALAAGLVLFLAGFGLILEVAGLFLMRFGVPADVAFLIVAALVIGGGAACVRSGIGGLKPARLVPARSISQISSLLGGLEP